MSEPEPTVNAFDVLKRYFPQRRISQEDADAFTVEMARRLGITVEELRAWGSDMTKEDEAMGDSLETLLDRLEKLAAIRDDKEMRVGITLSRNPHIEDPMWSACAGSYNGKACMGATPREALEGLAGHIMKRLRDDAEDARTRLAIVEKRLRAAEAL